jgi:hypothetical protein
MQRYFNSLAEQNGGKALAGASVLVQNFSDLTTATVYSTNSAIAGNIKTNPLTSASDGSFFFYADDGRYSLVIVAQGTTSTASDILLEDSSNGVPIASTATWALGAAAASTATTALAASTATYAVITGTASHVKGTVTNDDAATGYAGEYIASTNTNTIPMGSGTAVNITTCTLSPGDYDCDGLIDIIPAATTALNRVLVGVSTTSAAYAGQGTFGTTVFGNFAPGTNEITLHTPTHRIQVSSAQGTATVYLVGSAVFTTSSLNAHGNLNFRRAR